MELPTDIVLKIIDMTDDIDLRRAFGLRPRKLDASRYRDILYALQKRDGLVYNVDTQSLHIFRIPGCSVVRRPIKLDYMDQWGAVFNLERKVHEVEITCSSGNHCTVPVSTDFFYTEFKVLLSSSWHGAVLSPQQTVLFSPQS
jgi:hypothetical protein